MLKKISLLLVACVAIASAQLNPTGSMWAAPLTQVTPVYDTTSVTCNTQINCDSVGTGDLVRQKARVRLQCLRLRVLKHHRVAATT